MFKNVASQKLLVFAFDRTTNAPKTGDAANITAYISKDFGTVTILGDTSATEMDATNAPGYYLFDLTQAETNADSLIVGAKSSTSNVSVIGVPGHIYTVPANFSTASIDSSGRVDVAKISGTAQTARDIGASVLLSPGTGTGQVSLTSGVVSANATQFAGQAITAGAGVTIPASIASPTNITAGTITTVTNLTNAPTSGDFTSTMKSSLNASTPASVTGAVGSVTGNVGGNVTGSVGSVASGGITAASIATDAIDADALAASAISEIQAGLSSLDAAGVRTAVGLSTANLDTQLSTIDTVVDAIKAKTDNLPSDPSDASVIDASFTSIATAISDLTAFVDTEVAAIKAKTDNLPVDPADASDIAASFTSISNTLTTMSGYIDTEVAAIKAKTDLIPAAPAAVGDVPTAIQNADALLNRNLGAGTDSGGRTVRNALRPSVNKVSTVTHTGEVTVFKEDDTTEAWRAPLTVDANALPITGLDPA